MLLVTSGRASDQDCFCAPEKSKYHGSHVSWKDLYESSGIFPLLQGPGKFWKSISRSWKKVNLLCFKFNKFALRFVCHCSVNNDQSMVYLILHPLLYTTVAMFLKCSVINSCCFSLNLYVVGLQKQSGQISPASWKVLKFMVSSMV